MSKFIYKNPLEQGYKQFKLTKKQHNLLIPTRKKTWKNRFEYYINDQGIIFHQFPSLPAIILYTIIFPIVVLIHGIGNMEEIIKEYKELYNPKKYGGYMKIKEIIK
jgi:hypothetical protein